MYSDPVASRAPTPLENDRDVWPGLLVAAGALPEGSISRRMSSKSNDRAQRKPVMVAMGLREIRRELRQKRGRVNV